MNINCRRMQTNQNAEIIPPPAPRLRLIDLPQLADECHEEDLSAGRSSDEETLPNDILLRLASEDAYTECLHHSLVYTETWRPIASTAGGVSPLFDSWQDTVTPATIPPTKSMTIRFVDGRDIVVIPPRERSFVSIYDVRITIALILDEEERVGSGLRGRRDIFSVETWNGSKTEVGLWVWKGLLRRSSKDRWELHL